ncbi:hypothetical protein, partial [Rhizobium skierniewicense]
LQTMDNRAKSFHPKSDPSNAGTEQLDSISRHPKDAFAGRSPFNSYRFVAINMLRDKHHALRISDRMIWEP